MKEESSLPNMTNFMLTAIASALVAGISAYYVTAWNKKEVDVNVKKEQDNNDSSVLLAQLTEIKQRLNDLEFRKTRRRRTSTSIRSFRTDEREFYVSYERILFMCSTLNTMSTHIFVLSS